MRPDPPTKLSAPGQHTVRSHYSGALPLLLGDTSLSVFVYMSYLPRGSNQPIPKEINPEHSTGRTDADAPILWPPNAKSRLVGKDPDAGKD